jgi:hypothetical protein
MDSRLRIFFLCAHFLLLLLPQAVLGEWSGSAGVQSRLFPQSPLFAKQNRIDLSLVLEPEYYHEWRNGKQSVTFRLFSD